MDKKATNLISLVNKIALVFTIVYIAIYYYICIKNAINFPMGDDLYQTSVWFNSFYNAPTSADQLKLYFSQFNAHFLLFSYLLIVLDYHLFGFYSFVHLIVVGNFLVLGIWYHLFRLFKSKGQPNFLLFLPATLVLFTPVDQMINWAATAPHCGSMILFGIISVWMLTKQKTVWTIGALFFLFMSMFSLVGGITVPIAGALMFTVLPQKKYKHLLMWAIGSALFYALFFKLWVNNGISQHHYKEAVLLFFSFLGSAGSAESVYSVMSPLVGFISFLFLTYVCFRTDFFKNHPAVFGALLFMAGIAAITAMGRNNFGHTVTAKNKYFWMQGTFIACFFITFLKQKFFDTQRKQLYALLLLLVWIIPVTYTTYSFEKKKIDRSHSNTVLFTNQFNREIPPGTKGGMHAYTIQFGVKRGIRDGYFKLPDFYEGRPIEERFQPRN